MKYAQIVMGSAGTGKVGGGGLGVQALRAAARQSGPVISGASRALTPAACRAFPLAPLTAAQSTYCSAMQEHGAAAGRSIRVANLDPAAESFKYQAAFGAWRHTADSAAVNGRRKVVERPRLLCIRIAQHAP
jgi:hypothetical protein